MTGQNNPNSTGGDSSDKKDILYGKLYKGIFLDGDSDFSDEKIAKIRLLTDELKLLSSDYAEPDFEKALARLKNETARINQAKKRARLASRFKKIRNITAALAVVCCLSYMTNSIVADATGFNFLGMVVDFSKSLTFFKGNSESQLPVDELAISKYIYTDISSAIDSLGVSIPIPEKLPEGISIKQIEVAKRPEFSRMDIIYIDQQGNIIIRLSYQSYSSDKAGRTNKFADLYTQADTYNMLGSTVYVYTDAENQLVYWNLENFVITMQTRLNLKEVHQIMNSMKMNGG